MTDLERYCTGILDGTIVACRRMKQVAERLLEDLASPGEFHFDPDIAARHIDFIQQFCKVPSGRLGAVSYTHLGPCQRKPDAHALP